MGQYYVAIILGETGAPEVVRTWLGPSGSKLMEHSYLRNPHVLAVEHLLSPKGMFYKSRLVWAGDYAEPEEGTTENLYHRVVEKEQEKEWQTRESADYRYIVNHTKKVYIDKNALSTNIHPLPLLTSEGNGAGGGDYRGDNETLCGLWARDVISVEHELPEGYTVFNPEFWEH